LGTIFSILLGLIYKNYISDNFDFDTLGALSFGISTISIISIIISFGYKDSLVFFIPKYLALNEPSKLVNHIKSTILINLISLSFILLFIIFANNVFAVKILTYKSFNIYIYHFFLLLFLNSFVAIGVEIVNGYEKINFSIMVEKFLKLPIKVLFAYILINIELKFSGVLWAEILASSFALFLFTYFIFKLFKSNNTLNENLKSHPKLLESEKTYIKNIYLNNILSNTVDYSIILIIIFYTSYKTLGVYTLLNSFSFFITIILLSINSVLKPIISRLFAKNDINTIKKYFSLSSKIIFTFTIPIFLIMYVLIDPITFYFNLNLPGTETLLALLIIGQLINALKGPVFITLRMMGFSEDLKKNHIIIFVINFLLYGIFVSKYGLVGIGIASILSYTFQAFLGSLTLYVRTKIHMFDKGYINHILLSLFLAGIIYYIQTFSKVIDNNYKVILIKFLIIFIFFIINFIYLTKKNSIKIYFNTKKI